MERESSGAERGSVDGGDVVKKYVSGIGLDCRVVPHCLGMDIVDVVFCMLACRR